MITLNEAVLLLKQGKIVALPTETVYGLAARYDCQDAIGALYELKGRPKNKAMTVNLYCAEDIKKFLLYIPKDLEKLIEFYWPGPLTVVVEIKEEMILPHLRCGGATCGFRMQRHELTRTVIREVGPIILPSANLSGQLPAKSAQQVVASLKVPVLDGGVCEIGIESTVISFKSGVWRVLREGAVSKQSLEKILGYKPATL